MKRLIWIALCLALLFAWGCAKKQVSSEPEETTQEETMAPEKAPMEETYAEEEAAEPMMEETDPYDLLPTTHTVVKGECLWWIAEYKDIYNDPFMWPLIYKANRDQINNPDLIYPDQVFSIPRAFELTEVQESRRQAGAPSPYNPDMDANLPQNVKDALGWGN